LKFTTGGRVGARPKAAHELSMLGLTAGGEGLQELDEKPEITGVN